MKWLGMGVAASKKEDGESGDTSRALLPDLEGGTLGVLRSAANRFGVTKPPPPPPTRCTQLGCGCCAEMSYKQRMVGFIFCLSAGLMLSASSLLSLSSLLLGNPVPFAVKYTLGNLLSIGAASFLVGPGTMCKNMFGRERRASSLLYLSSLCSTLTCIFYVHSHILTFISIVLQFGAMLWYVSSYLPFGQSLLRRSMSVTRLFF
uniref:Vesicle transport protein n=1 Tax=Coccolithus braarudii TaxID=221442 RepID=A0A7S0L323_9EUKA|mmetsp:Transcript_12479/g.26916  ORF Transcript_12479/g.26916 Transcript_12479/m.26916 type:complete len:204 (+) Transcript_12479:47-658(+)